MLVKFNRCSEGIFLSAITLIAIISCGEGTAQAKHRNYRVIHKFSRSVGGWFPTGVPAIGENGDMYGTTIHGGTYNSGTIYKLVAPRQRGGSWKHEVLYSFTGKDGYPTSLIVGEDRGLYGAGGGPNTAGFIFRLAPPAGRRQTWSYAVLFTLTKTSQGGVIQGNLVLDAKGNLYGANELGGNECIHNITCGTVFELKRPDKAGDDGDTVYSTRLLALPMG